MSPRPSASPRELPSNHQPRHSSGWIDGQRPDLADSSQRLPSLCDVFDGRSLPPAEGAGCGGMVRSHYAGSPGPPSSLVGGDSKAPSSAERVFLGRQHLVILQFPQNSNRWTASDPSRSSREPPLDRWTYRSWDALRISKPRRYPTWIAPGVRLRKMVWSPMEVVGLSCQLARICASLLITATRVFSLPAAPMTKPSSLPPAQPDPTTNGFATKLPLTPRKQGSEGAATNLDGDERLFSGQASWSIAFPSDTASSVALAIDKFTTSDEVTKYIGYIGHSTTGFFSLLCGDLSWIPVSHSPYVSFFFPSLFIYTQGSKARRKRI